MTNNQNKEDREVGTFNQIIERLENIISQQKGVIGEISVSVNALIGSQPEPPGSSDKENNTIGVNSIASIIHMKLSEINEITTTLVSINNRLNQATS